MKKQVVLFLVLVLSMGRLYCFSTKKRSRGERGWSGLEERFVRLAVTTVGLEASGAFISTRDGASKERRRRAMEKMKKEEKAAIEEMLVEGGKAVEAMRIDVEGNLEVSSPEAIKGLGEIPMEVN
ncbi:hypothetical protein HN446_02045 [bacterium]|jgi:hypothetical protein|nr:hypothetical protein [bacterium]